MMSILKSVFVPLAPFLLLVSCVGFIEALPDRPSPSYERPQQVRALPDGDYRNSCSNCSISFNELNCWCKNRNGFEKSTSISLRQCKSRISNDDGRLVCGYAEPKPVQKPLPLGTYKESCSKCSMNGSELRCSCQDTDGNLRSTSLETRYCKKGISNDDGRLVCGSVAAKPSPKPLPFGSYKESCSSCSMYGSVLRCSCKDANGLTRSSSLETQYCSKGISNDDGSLICGSTKPKPTFPNGSYMQTCRGCDVTSNRLSCECQDGNGVYRPTSIIYPGCYNSIENCDGRLNCGGC